MKNLRANEKHNENKFWSIIQFFQSSQFRECRNRSHTNARHIISSIIRCGVLRLNTDKEGKQNITICYLIFPRDQSNNCGIIYKFDNTSVWLGGHYVNRVQHGTHNTVLWSYCVDDLNVLFLSLTGCSLPIKKFRINAEVRWHT